MITGTSERQHKKHANLPRAGYGNFGRNEFALHGAPCSVIQEKARVWASALSKWKIAYADADHQAENVNDPDFSLSYTHMINYGQLNFNEQPNGFKNRALFNDADLVIINGNHFTGIKQIVVIHPGKSLEGKSDKLTDIALILLADGHQLPQYLSGQISKDVPVLALDDDKGIVQFLSAYLTNQVPVIRGLVLAGGESKRMQSDKGSIVYHGKSQRAYSYELLFKFCTDVFISGKDGGGYPLIADTFTGLGPFGGILSAMQHDPSAAWLTIACDLPYLSESTLEYLIANRNPSKLATAFNDSDGRFPEPLITIWEPRAYPVMLQFLSQGYSCPRKVLINTDIALLDAPDTSEFRNVNFPHQRDEALKFFGVK